MKDIVIYENYLNLIRNIHLMSIYFSDMYHLDNKIVLTKLFENLFLFDKSVPKTIFGYPNKKDKIDYLKKKLKLLNLPISGNKEILYNRLCNQIDQWKLNFDDSILEKYV